MSRVTFERIVPGDYLVRLAASDLGRSYKSVALNELGVLPGDAVVDLGCGPGADLTSFAEATGPTGSVVGIDADPAAITQAAPFALSRTWIDLRVGDIHAIDLPDSSVDRVHADRVLQHVADPVTVLREARRVLRPGGRAVFAEPDYDTLVIDYPETGVVRAYRRFIIEHVVRNACIGRQLSRLSQQAGFTSTRVVPITTVFRDAAVADKILGLHRVTDHAVTAGYLDAAAAAAWLNHLATETFFASATLFVVVAESSVEQ